MSQWTAIPVRRAALFSAVAIGLVGGWLALLESSWHGSASLHTVLETVAVCTALFAGLLAAVKCRANRGAMYLCIAAGLFGAALLDGHHAAVTATAVGTYLPSDVTAIDCWSWAASRLFFAAMLLLAWFASRRGQVPSPAGQGRAAALVGFATVTCVGFIIYFSFADLPRIDSPDLPFPRLFEFVPALLFALALLGFSSRQRWQTDPLESWLILALTISVAVQALYMARSAALFDAMYVAAHALKIASYACLVAGFLAETHASLSHERQVIDELSHEAGQRHQAEADLHEERRNLRLALDAVKSGMWWWDLSTGEIEWDTRMHELFGLKPGLFGGTPRDWKRLVHPADAERAERRRREALEGSRPYDDTYRAENPSGRVRIIRDRGIILRDADGTATRMVGHCVDVTQSVRATQDLAESEARFRSLADHAPVLIWMADKNKKLVHFNRQWLEFTGRTLKQEQGEGWALGVHPDDRQQCMDTYEAAFAALQPFQIEFRLRRHDGVYCWMMDTGNPRFTEDGEFLGYVGTCVNIDELNEAMQSLRVTQFAVDRAPDAVFWVNSAGHFVYVNDQACRALKYSASELLALSVPDVDPNIPADRWTIFWEGIKRDNVVLFDTRIRRKDGSDFPAELTIGFIETPAGEIACAFARDVTERRRQQEALRASEERFELAIQGTREGLWDWTLATGEVWFSDRNAEMLGYEPAEWPHTLEMFNHLLHPDDAERTWEAVARHFASGAPYDVEFRLRAKDDEYRWIRSRGIAIRDEAGQPIRMVGSHQDIQDRKEAQHALERTNAELRQFAYIASHDLQEPLRTISRFCGLLARDYKGRLDDTAEQSLAEAIAASRRLQSLVKDLAPSVGSDGE